ncbi:transcription factor Opi1-domain-containing protein [Globomyces pollinis-pini]|nr:transcription factor Opi1-domain-containing protein [Globomyces pollinis-pini]
MEQKQKPLAINNIITNDNFDHDEQLAVEALGGLRHQPFLQRVHSIPLVNRTVSQLSHVYETTKNSNGVLKYSAESVESGVLTITKPVLSTLEPVLAPLDRFACNQLDRMERSFPSISNEENKLPPIQIEHSPNSVSIPSPAYSDDTSVNDRPRGYIPTVIGTVGASMGMLREDTIRALRYCVNYLRSALGAMVNQMNLLGQSISDMASSSRAVLNTQSNPDGTVATRTDNFIALIAHVKREIVQTLRNVVDLLAMHSLPVTARESVRSFILSLPQRLSTIRQPSTPATLEMDSLHEAHNVLKLADEARSTLTNIENVLHDTVSAAEATFQIKDQTLRRRVSSINSDSTMNVDTSNGDVDMEVDMTN